MPLVDFIETPSQNCTEENLISGVAEVVTAIHENSGQIVSIISSCFSPATFILHDLAKKMELQNCQQYFALLYDKHLDELVSLCVWSWHDLKRFIDNSTSYLEKIMSAINKNEACVQRLLNDASNAEDIINYIKELNPDYEFENQLADLVVSKRSLKP